MHHSGKDSLAEDMSQTRLDGLQNTGMSYGAALFAWHPAAAPTLAARASKAQ